MATYQEIVDTLKAALDDRVSSIAFRMGDHSQIQSALIAYGIVTNNNEFNSDTAILSFSELAQEWGVSEESSNLTLINFRYIIQGHLRVVGNAYLAERESEAGE